jgi:hypothetical protein
LFPFKTWLLMSWLFKHNLQLVLDNCNRWCLYLNTLVFHKQKWLINVTVVTWRVIPVLGCFSCYSATLIFYFYSESM